MKVRGRNPWRLVEEAEIVKVYWRTGFGDSGTVDKWLLTLTCGHVTRRTVRKRLDANVDTGEVMLVPEPAPRKVRCEECGQG